MIELKKKYLIGYIVVFLLVIYIVPIVQTVSEYRTNENHRIQMLDLCEDLFVTPMKHANKQSVMLDSLGLMADALAAEVARINAAAGDTTTEPWDPELAIALCDESAIKLKMLKNGAIDYNRHIQSGHNIHAAADTVKPYFRSLVAAQGTLDTVLGSLQSSIDAGIITAGVTELKAMILQAQKEFGGKKTLKDYPSLTLVAFSRILVGAEYLRPYEKEMEKSSVFANGVRPWYLFTYYGVFGDVGEKGVQGRNGWLFYRPDVEYLTKNYVFDHRSKIVDANDTPIRDSIVDSIASFRDQLAARGIELLVAVMPVKPSIYPEMLSAGMDAKSSGKFSHSLRMMKELNAKGIQTVDLFAALSEERTKDAAAGDSIYLRTDTHFRSRGVTATARAIADRVKQYPWFSPGSVEYVVDTLTIPRHGDVADMTKLPGMEIRDLRLSFLVESTICYQVSKVTRDSSGTIVGKLLYKDDFQRSDILVLGDSFSRIYQTDEPRSAGWISHLSRELSRPVASLVNDGGASTMVREMLARKPQVLKNKKLVIWEVVERDFRFGAEGWKNIKIGM